MIYLKLNSYKTPTSQLLPNSLFKRKGSRPRVSGAQTCGEMQLLCGTRQPSAEIVRFGRANMYILRPMNCRGPFDEMLAQPTHVCFLLGDVGEGAET